MTARGGISTMVRTRKTLPLIVAGLALALSAVAAPAAQPQSVKGSGTYWPGPFAWGPAKFDVRVWVRNNGTVAGEVDVNIFGPTGYTGWQSYRAVSLVVVGNHATVTTIDPH